jgi:hypothetical protein
MTSDGGGEIFDGDRFPALGHMDNGRFEDGVFVDHVIEGGAVARTRVPRSYGKLSVIKHLSRRIFTFCGSGRYPPSTIVGQTGS